MLQIDEVVSAKLEETRDGGGHDPWCSIGRLQGIWPVAFAAGSKTAIGRSYNLRDHSTVCYSIRKIENCVTRAPRLGSVTRCFARSPLVYSGSRIIALQA